MTQLENKKGGKNTIFAASVSVMEKKKITTSHAVFLFVTHASS